jgi:hypothetical protein
MHTFVETFLSLGFNNAGSTYKASIRLSLSAHKIITSNKQACGQEEKIFEAIFESTPSG